MPDDTGLLGRMLMLVGGLILLAGLIMMVGGRLPLGRLPGDFSGSRGGFHFYFPLGTSLLLSVVLTVVLILLVRH
jgi:hypothetical protein